MYGEGVSKAGEILDIASNADIIKKSGSWYAYNETKLGQGRENVKTMLINNPDLLDEIEAKIRTHFKLDSPQNYEYEYEDENDDQDLLQMFGV